MKKIGYFILISFALSSCSSVAYRDPAQIGTGDIGSKVLSDSQINCQVHSVNIGGKPEDISFARYHEENKNKYSGITADQRYMSGSKDDHGNYIFVIMDSGGPASQVVGEVSLNGQLKLTYTNGTNGFSLNSKNKIKKTIKPKGSYNVKYHFALSKLKKGYSLSFIEEYGPNMSDRGLRIMCD